jgi:hypothetical protein
MNNRPDKVGIMAAIMVPALLFLASCEIPQSARVKASPVFQIPIPLGREGISNSFIRPYIDVDEIKRTLSGGVEPDKPIGVYEYAAGADSKAFMDHLKVPLDGNDPVQAYLLTYPIFNVDMDLAKHVNKVSPDGSNVPPIQISADVAEVLRDLDSRYGYNLPQLPYQYWIDPFNGKSPEVDLRDLKSLVSNIVFNDGVSFKIKIPEEDRDRAEQLENAIRVRAPQLKFGDTGNSPSSWVKGKLSRDKSELEFSSNRKDEINQGDHVRDALLLNGDPRSDRVIIDIRLVNIASVGEYETELNFDWYSMDVKPQGNSTGEFAGFDLGTYLKEIGGGVEFLRVFASLYMHIPAGIDGLTVNITDNQTRPIQDADIPAPDRRYIVLPAGEELPWLDHTSIQYDFGDVLNNARSIKYTIIPPSAVTVLREDIDLNQNTEITANLAVILPMAFRFPPEVESLEIADEGITKRYFSIGFKELDKFLEGDNSAMSQIEDQLGGGISGLSLNLSDIKNDLISSFYVAVQKDLTRRTGPDNWHLVKIEDGGGGSFRIDNAVSLARFPQIKFLIPAAEKTGDGLFYIKAQKAEDTAVFDVKISVQADINLDNEIRF